MHHYLPRFATGVWFAVQRLANKVAKGISILSKMLKPSLGLHDFPLEVRAASLRQRHVCTYKPPHNSSNARYKPRREIDRAEKSCSEASKFCTTTRELCESVARLASLDARRFLVCANFHFFTVTSLEATYLNFCFATGGIVRQTGVSPLEQECYD